MAEKKKKSKKPPVYDDGRTIVDMNVDGMPWYDPHRSERKKRDKKDRPTFKERLAMIAGAYRATILPMLIFLGGLVVVMLLIFLWLS